MRGEKGFTLIEIMVSLVLVGLIAAIAGTSVITATRSYLFARENNTITQKAQLAMERFNREFIELSNVKAATSTCIIYEVPYGNAYRTRAIARVGNTIQLFDPFSGSTCPSDGGDVLVDGVQTFSLLYNPDPNVTASLWSMGQDIRDLFALNVQIALARPDTGGAVEFYSTVSPRNNNNTGGAALPTTSNPPPEYSGKRCFVATAAYGDADHPVVEVLRQFRDQVLLPTAPGKALVRCYYEAGPWLAAAIEGNPPACLAVRILVIPAAGFAVVALNWPLLVPVILLLSWGLAFSILKVLRRQSMRRLPRLQRQRGAMLVTLIAALVAFSAFGAVMVAMFGTAALSQASGNTSHRAYYMAESGFRYAASRYIAVDMGSERANDTARDNLLESEIHGKTFSLATGDGGFRLDVYPYYYRVIEAPTGNVLRTKVTGGYPLQGDLTDLGLSTSVRIKKADGSYPASPNVRISRVTSVTGTNEVRFTKLSGNWDSDIDVGSTVSPMCIPDYDEPLTLRDVDGDGRLDLEIKANTGARLFPEKNGVFEAQFVEGPRILSYRRLNIDNGRLEGISDPSGASLPTGPLVNPGLNPALWGNNIIALMNFVRIESTGTIGQGSAAVSRKVTYYTPIGYTAAPAAPKEQFRDDMSNLSNWLTGDSISRIGAATPGTAHGSAMKVDAMQEVTTIPGGGVLKFREFQVGLNLSGATLLSGENVYPAVQREWLRAGNYLSYDLQVKALYPSALYPSARQAFGLTFRLDDKGNALGFTFAKGVPGADASDSDNDGIPFDWLDSISGYTSFTPVVLFWMKEYARSEANPEIVDSPHSETPAKFDDPPPWGTGTRAILTTREAAFWRNGDRVRFVNSGGALPVPIVAGRDYYVRKVPDSGRTYLYLFNTESAALNNTAPFWQGLVDITVAGSGTSTVIVQDPTFTKLAHQVLTPGNDHYLLLDSMSGALKSWVNFLARVVEASSVSFINGGGTALREIRSGEIVYQTSNNLPGGTLNAIYRVMRSPVYRSAAQADRNWTGGTARGVLLLERIKDNAYSNPTAYPFTVGSNIFVGDYPAGIDSGTVGVPGFTDQAFRVRDNWLLFYVGDPAGNAPADTDPFNNFRNPISRGWFLWPPDDPADTVSGSDNFTLLRFSDFVNAAHCTGFFTKANPGPAGDVIRFTSPDGSMFYSPQGGPLFPTGRSEFGLHAYGIDAVSTEFDDFAIQFGPGYRITRQGFLQPVQQ